MDKPLLCGIVESGKFSEFPHWKRDVDYFKILRDI